MSRPLLLDLYCGAGGAAMGYHRAGFDIIGVDINPQPDYPFQFVQADALAYLAKLDQLHRPGYLPDAIHASPPCHDHSSLRSTTKQDGTAALLPATRTALKKTGLPWVIENVPGAPMRVDYRLCGCLFGLPRLRRVRWFETSWRGFDLCPPCSHHDWAVTITGNPGKKSQGKRDGSGTIEDWKRALGIDWMTSSEMAQAIPPAYTHYIGTQLLNTLKGPQWSATNAPSAGAPSKKPATATASNPTTTPPATNAPPAATPSTSP